MVTPCPVTGAVLPALLHQVKVIACGAARVVAIVHAQQTHHFKRNRPHRHGGGKGHTACAKTLLQRRLLQRLQPGFLRHSQWNWLRVASLVAGLLPAGQRLLQPVEQGLLHIVLRRKHVLRQLAQALGPHIGLRILQRIAPPAHQALQHGSQHTGQLGIQSADFVIRLNLPPCWGLLHAVVGGNAAATCGIAQQHAAQAKPCAVVVAARRQPQTAALCVTQAPANTGTRHPLRELGYILRGQPKAGRHSRHIQQIAQLTQAAALLRQAQQPLQRHQHGAGGAGAQVRNIKRDKTCIGAAILTKHRPNRGRGFLNVRQHDDDIARLQRCLPWRGGLRKQTEQLIVQHLQLTHQAVGTVKDDGAIAGGNAVFRLRSPRVLLERQQIAHAALHLLQQRALVGRRIVKHIHTGPHRRVHGIQGLIELIQQPHIVAALAAPGSQQRVGMGVHGLQRHQGQIAPVLQRLTAALHAQQLAPVNGIGPVVAARVGHGQHHLGVACQCIQKAQHGQRHMAEAKQHHARRHLHTGGRRLAQGAQYQGLQGGARCGFFRLRQVLHNRAPQQGLPLLPSGQGLLRLAQLGQHIMPRLPRLQPVCTVDLVLVEQVGQPLCQLQQTLWLLGTQVIRNRGKGGLVQAGRQQAHKAPRQRHFFQGRRWGHRLLAQNLPVGAPDKARRQLHLGGSAYAQLLGHAHLEPLGRAIALHQHDFLLQRRQRMRAHPCHQCVSQGFGAVAMQGHQTRCD